MESDEITTLQNKISENLKRISNLENREAELETQVVTLKRVEEENTKLKTKLELEVKSKEDAITKVSELNSKLTETNREIISLKENYEIQKKNLSNLVEEKLARDSENGWTRYNVDTIELWKKTCSENVFIYETTLYNHRKLLDILSLVNFVLSIILGTISLAYLGINDIAYPNVALGLKITFVIICFFVCVLCGSVKIYDFFGIISRLNSYIEKADGLLSVLINETTLPIELRDTASNVIKKNKDVYFEILKSPPEIGHKQYNWLLSAYKKAI